MHLEFTKSEREKIIEDAGFTDFELTVFGFLCRGWYYIDIAEELHCCKDKVGKSARNIKRKIMKVI